MFEKLKDLPAGIDGLKATGKLSKEDYENVFEPLLEQAHKEGRRLRLLCEIGPDFEGVTPGGAWEDKKVGFRYLRLFDGCAIVTDIGWMREATNLARFMMPCPMQVFGNQERDKAIAWLASHPEGPAVSHRLLPEWGVLLVEVKDTLRSRDFDALAATVDPWIEAHGKLEGIVIHAREFPGWENFGSLVRHVRFVRDHQRKVKRIALAVDGKLATVAPRIAEHFIQAEVKTYGYGELSAAVEWAEGRPSKCAAAEQTA